MFFDMSYFKELGEAQAKLAAKLANQAINAAGIPIFGKAYEGDELDGFSTTRASADTHVAFALGVETMGRLKPRAKTMRIDHIVPSDLENSYRERNAQLEQKLKDAENGK